MLLAKGGVDPDYKDNSGRTPVSWAAGSRHEAVVEMLLAKDAVDPDSKDSDDWTPLSWSTWSGYEVVIELPQSRNGTPS